MKTQKLLLPILLLNLCVFGTAQAAPEDAADAPAETAQEADSEEGTNDPKAPPAPEAKSSDEAAVASESKPEASEEAVSASESEAEASEEVVSASESDAEASEEAASTSEPEIAKSGDPTLDALFAALSGASSSSETKEAMSAQEKEALEERKAIQEEIEAITLRVQHIQALLAGEEAEYLFENREQLAEAAGKALQLKLKQTALEEAVMDLKLKTAAGQGKQVEAAEAQMELELKQARYAVDNFDRLMKMNEAVQELEMKKLELAEEQLEIDREAKAAMTTDLQARAAMQGAQAKLLEGQVELQSEQLDARKRLLPLEEESAVRSYDLQKLEAEVAKRRLELEKQLSPQLEALTQAQLDARTEEAKRNADLAPSITELQKMQVEGMKQELAFQNKMRPLEQLFMETRYAHALEMAKRERIMLARENRRLEAEEALYATGEAAPVERPLEPFDAETGVLRVSDRRIELDGVVTYSLANMVSDRIDFFNNISKTEPIFLVINSSPGGSALAGGNILSAMKASDAPIHVVVKQYAASMAAVITSTADNSYIMPNALFLHHEVRAGAGTKTVRSAKEFFASLDKWNKRFLGPIASRMGLKDNDEETAVEQLSAIMYEQNVGGDWDLFGDEAVEQKWVDHVVTEIEEESIMSPEPAHTAKITIYINQSDRDLVRGDAWMLTDSDGIFINDLGDLDGPLLKVAN